MTSREYKLQLAREIQALPRFTKRQRLKYSLVSREQFQAVMDFLLRHISQNNAGLQQAAQHIGISYPLIIKWRNRLRFDTAYNPKEDYSKLHRAMSDRLEEQIICEVETNFIEKGYYFNNQLLKLIAQAAWQNAPSEDKLRQVFRASNKWCKDFRKRHGYVWRKAHLKRRPTLNATAEAYRQQFKASIENLIQDLNSRGLLFTLCNMDETSWKLAYFGQLTWAKKGAREVKITANYNIKDSFTCLATISADTSGSVKLPLFLIAKGKQERCHQQFGRIKEAFEDTEIYHSESGWSNVDVMSAYLRWLRSIYDKYYEGHPNYEVGHTTIHLIIDCYASHRHEVAKNIASELNICLHFVPAGATDEYQPLDIRVFGALKAMARKAWYQVLYQDPAIVPTRSKAAFILAQCWNDLSQDVLDSAWSLYKKAIYQEQQEERVTDIYEHVLSSDQFHQTITDSIASNREIPGEFDDNDYYSTDENSDEDEEQNEIGNSTEESKNEPKEEDDTQEGDDFEGWENGDDDWLESVKANFCENYHTNPQDPNDEQFEIREDDENEYSEEEPDESNQNRIHAEEFSAEELPIPEAPNENTGDQVQQNDTPEPNSNENENQINFAITDIDDFMQQETRNTERRAQEWQISPNSVDTIYGIQNLGKSCYFNSFMQLLLTIPDIENVMIPRESCSSDEQADLYDFILAFYNMMQSNPSIIPSAEIELLLQQHASNIRDIINTKGGSCPETFMRDFLRRDVVEFVTVSPDRTVLEQVPFTEKQFLFVIRTDGLRKKPLAFPLSFKHGNVKWGLKSVITHPFNHFIYYLREGVQDYFIRVNDSSVQYKQYIPETLTNIGFYLRVN